MGASLWVCLSQRSNPCWSWGLHSGVVCPRGAPHVAIQNTTTIALFLWEEYIHWRNQCHQMLGYRTTANCKRNKGKARERKCESVELFPTNVRPYYVPSVTKHKLIAQDLATYFTPVTNFANYSLPGPRLPNNFVNFHTLVFSP